MATFHRDDDRVHVFVKGAPDVLLARCDRWLAGGEDRPLDVDSQARIDAEYIALAAGGLRGLLIASRTIPARAFDASGDLLAWVNGLTFLGLVGLMDPPRPEAQEAIAQCKQAGIAVKMITGDHTVHRCGDCQGTGARGPCHQRRRARPYGCCSTRRGCRRYRGLRPRHPRA